MIQCGKIQEESIYYSVFDQGCKKRDGKLPLIGASTSLLAGEHGSEIATEIELICSTEEEKREQIANVKR